MCTGWRDRPEGRVRVRGLARRGGTRGAGTQAVLRHRPREHRVRARGTNRPGRHERADYGRDRSGGEGGERT